MMSSGTIASTSSNSPPEQVSETSLKAITKKISDSVKKGDEASARAELVDAASKIQSAGGNIKDLSGSLDVGLRANGIDTDEQKATESQKTLLERLFNEARELAAKPSADLGS